ncbi:ABC transporter permease [Candidatus Saccharibacteria bacterium]|nr:ABC transporter permease [Candidatus Saccharibacteria bacterium]
MKKFLGKYRYSRILLKELVKTDFKLRYQGSVLGYLWSVLKPLMLFAILYVVFVRFLHFGAGIPHYAVSLLAAIVCWNFFAEATGQGMQSVVVRGDLLRKISFPKYIVVVSATISALINFVINLAVVTVFAALNGVVFRWTVLLVPLFVIELYIFAVAVAFFLSTLYAKFRDISHIWEVFMQGAFYVTPIIVPVSMIASMSVVASKIMLLSPVAQVIQDIRYSLITAQTETVWNYLGNHIFAFIPLVIVVIALVVGSTIFRKNSKKFAEMI